jgi:hypothetical protein
MQHTDLLDKIQKAINILGGIEGVDALIAGELIVTRKNRKAEATIVQVDGAVDLDPVITFNRTGNSVFPSGIVEFLRQDTERDPPIKCRISEIKKWYHPLQASIVGVRAGDVYAALRVSNELKYCLTLRNLREIRQLGPEVYEKYFEGECIFAWGSLAYCEGGIMVVPYTYNSENNLPIKWARMDELLNHKHPCVHFPL